MDDYVIFTVDGQKYAIDLNVVDLVLSSVLLKKCNADNGNILGLLNLHGTMIPALDVRQCLGGEFREMEPSDQMIVCKREGKKIVLCVDRVIELQSLQESQSKSIKEEFTFSQYIDRALTHHEEVYYVLSEDKLFSLPIAVKS